MIYKNVYKALLIGLFLYSTSLYGQTIKKLEHLVDSKSTVIQITQEFSTIYSAPKQTEKHETGDVAYVFKHKTIPERQISIMYNEIFKQVWFYSLVDSSDKLPAYMQQFKDNGYKVHSPVTLQQGLVKKYVYSKGNYQGEIEIGAEAGEGKIIIDLRYEIK
jgi:hypothetical protein